MMKTFEDLVEEGLGEKEEGGKRREIKKTIIHDHRKV